MFQVLTMSDRVQQRCQSCDAQMHLPLVPYQAGAAEDFDSHRRACPLHLALTATSRTRSVQVSFPPELAISPATSVPRDPGVVPSGVKVCRCRLPPATDGDGVPTRASHVERQPGPGFRGELNAAAASSTTRDTPTVLALDLSWPLPAS